MIVSHRHRFIFAAVPKTGTHAVRRALREQMGDEDVEQVGLFVNKRFPWADLAAIQDHQVVLPNDFWNPTRFTLDPSLHLLHAGAW